MQHSIHIERITIGRLKKTLVSFADNFELALILDSNTDIFPSSDVFRRKYDLIAGFANKSDATHLITGFEELDKIDWKLKHWYLGFLTYDIKNRLETLHSENPDYHHWPELLFFEPSILVLLKNNHLEIVADGQNFLAESLLKEISSSTRKTEPVTIFDLKARITREDYLIRAEKIMNHIQRGDIYELNFCQEFFNYARIDPCSTYLSINSNSPSPFSAFLKVFDHYLLSASPERFLQKNDIRIISQPIKGTAPRSSDTSTNDFIVKSLQNSLKERSENIMITDLVRNDLSRIACKNSVLVEELCGIYAFPQVYQMISTISAKLKQVTFAEIIKATFPMGSMTGAPKIRAMELIDRYEVARRGLYSGSVGYIAPGMDFDFNVVIRSLQYNSTTNYLSYMSGSALTALCDIEKEYEECLLKNYAINFALQSTNYA